MMVTMVTMTVMIIIVIIGVIIVVIAVTIIIIMTTTLKMVVSVLIDRHPSSPSRGKHEVITRQYFEAKTKFDGIKGSMKSLRRYSKVGCVTVNPFTPESDQRQNSPAASQEYDITQYGELGFS